jgi:hypothetical protein
MRGVSSETPGESQIIIPEYPQNCRTHCEIMVGLSWIIIEVPLQLYWEDMKGVPLREVIPSNKAGPKTTHEALKPCTSVHFDLHLIGYM